MHRIVDGRVTVLVSRHPVVQEHLQIVRDVGQSRDVFRAQLRYIARYLAYDLVGAAETDGSTPTVIVPVLRAGLGLLEGALDVLTGVQVGFVGVRRDEQTLESSTYVAQLPAAVSGAPALILDPMVATGGSLARVCHTLRDRGVSTLTAIAVVVAPEAIRRLAAEDVELTIVCASVDEGLDASGFIVPGLGDAGDRLYGAR